MTEIRELNGKVAELLGRTSDELMMVKEVLVETVTGAMNYGLQ